MSQRLGISRCTAIVASVALCVACSSKSGSGGASAMDSGSPVGPGDSGAPLESGAPVDSGAPGAEAGGSDAGSTGPDTGTGLAATWTFKGGTATTSFSSGQSATVTVGGAGDTPGSIAFTFAAASASASVTFTTAGTLMDVSPSTLPADDAPSQSMFMGAINNPILYVSIDNTGSTSPSFAMTPAIVLSGALAQSTDGDVECQLDWYATMGGTAVWKEIPGADVMLSGTGTVTSLSIPAAGPPSGGTFELPSGQTVVAISCD